MRFLVDWRHRCSVLALSTMLGALALGCAEKLPPDVVDRGGGNAARDASLGGTGGAGASGTATSIAGARARDPFQLRMALSQRRAGQYRDLCPGQREPSEPARHRRGDIVGDGGGFRENRQHRNADPLNPRQKLRTPHLQRLSRERHRPARHDVSRRMRSRPDTHGRREGARVHALRSHFVHRSQSRAAPPTPSAATSGVATAAAATCAPAAATTRDDHDAANHRAALGRELKLGAAPGIWYRSGANES